MANINTTLGQACTLKAGRFVAANDIAEEYKEGLYPCYGGNGMRGYVADYSHEGTYPLIGRQGALCGNVNYAVGKFRATEHAVVVQPNLPMNVRWLYYKLLSMDLGQYATGAAQPGLAVAKLEQLPFSVPPMDEQDDLVALCDNVANLISLRKQQIAKLDELVKARFVEMFGDQETNPYNWEKCSIGECCSLKSGTSLAADVENEGGPVPYVKVGDMNFPGNERYITASSRYVSEGTAGNGLFPVGSILFPKRGGAIGTNKKRMTKLPVCADLNVMGVSSNGSLLPEYLFTYFELIDLGALSDGSSVPQINNKNIAPLQICVPPLDLQHQFAAFVAQTDQQKSTIQQSLAQLELLKKALMQKYFG